MAWASCKNVWYNGSKEVTGSKSRARRKKGRPSLKWTNDVGLNLRNLQ
jgi:hypothetical protein